MVIMDEHTNTTENSEQEMSELDKYWKAVLDNPSDFTGWTYLLQFVEQENLLEAGRKAYDAFFERYPYCYGYWKKYADLEKQHECLDRVQQVFERGVQAIGLSIDLWLHYLGFVIAQGGGEQEQDADGRIEALFERATIAAGLEYRSDRLWDTYVSWLKEKGTSKQVGALYDRLLKTPTQHYKRHFEAYQELLRQYHPRDVVSAEEFETLYKQITAKSAAPLVVATTTDDVAPYEALVGEGAADEAPPGVDESLPEVKSASDAPAPAPEKLELTEQETTQLIEKILEVRRGWHQTTEEEVVKRSNYEELIRRPYFHVKPLEKSQLRNWREYLDFEVANGTYERAVVLYERCLIACTLYEEFWLKYAKFIEKRDVDGARNVLRRACTVHLPQKPSLHLAWAALEERHGSPDVALEVIAGLEKQIPGLAAVALRRIGVERRRGNREAVEGLFQRYVDEAESTELRNFYASKFARYEAKIQGNTDRAKQILEDALKKDKTNVKLYLQLVDVEYQLPTLDADAVVAVFDRAIASGVGLEQRVNFCQRKLEFLEDFGSNIERVEQAHTEHQKLLKDLQLVRKHRLTTDATSGDGGTHASKRSKMDASVAHQSMNGDYNSATTTATTSQMYNMPPPHQPPMMGAPPMMPPAADPSMMPPPYGGGYPGYPPQWSGYNTGYNNYQQAPWGYPQQYGNAWPPMH